MNIQRGAKRDRAQHLLRFDAVSQKIKNKYSRVIMGNAGGWARATGASSLCEEGQPPSKDRIKLESTRERKALRLVFQTHADKKVFRGGLGDHPPSHRRGANRKIEDPKP